MLRLVCGLGVLLGAVACNSSSEPVACAGQCAPPYQLMVSFRGAVSEAAATAVIDHCAKTSPVFLRQEMVARSDGVQITVFTRERGSTASSRALYDCISASPRVAAAGWPA
jgi:hypothetical protein